MVRDVTTIELKRKTRNRLAARGSKGDSFDKIENEVLDKAEDCKEILGVCLGPIECKPGNEKCLKCDKLKQKEMAE